MCSSRSVSSATRLATAANCSDGVRPSGLSELMPGNHLILQTGHPDLKELVEVLAEDRTELGSLQQGDDRVGTQGKHTLVEVQPGQLPVDEPIGLPQRLRCPRQAQIGHGGRGLHGGRVRRSRTDARPRHSRPSHERPVGPARQSNNDAAPTTPASSPSAAATTSTGRPVIDASLDGRIHSGDEFRTELFGDATPEHDGRDVDQGAGRGDRGPERDDRAVDQLERNGIPFGDGFGDDARPHLAVAGKLDQSGGDSGLGAAARLGLDAHSPRVGLEVTETPASAAPPIGHDNDVADLTRDATWPVPQPTVEDQPAADPGTGEHPEHVSLPTSRTR